MISKPPLPTDLPLVGRERELARIRKALDAARGSRGGILVLRGQAGTGKSRLAQAARELAAQGDIRVALGRAYPVESGVPYALFADTLMPLLRELGSDTVAVLTRGRTAELSVVFPGIGGEVGPPPAEAAEFRTRLLWNFSAFMEALAARRPLLVVLEDVQWADASSLELLHFVARRVADHAVLLLLTLNDEATDTPSAVRSLLGLREAEVETVGPLEHRDTAELLERLFGVDRADIRDFTALLYGWTRGNPFFLEATLRALVESGRLRREGEVWVGWELERLELPPTVREAVSERLALLGPQARGLAELTAVAGGRALLPVLSASAGLPPEVVASGLEELCRAGVLAERVDEGVVAYDFTHPLMRETLYASVGLARARLLHARLAEALEAQLGGKAGDRAGEVAYHYSRAGSTAAADRAYAHLLVAGRNALERSANREAGSFLATALDLVDRRQVEVESAGARALVEDLARVRQRVGEYEEAGELWRRALALAAAEGDLSGVGRAHRRLGLLHHWGADFESALTEYDAGLEAAAGDPPLQARLRMARGAALQELGRPEEARADLERALALAEEAAEPALLARVHRALLMLHIFTGPPDRGREHGERALELAERAGSDLVACTALWGLAVLDGLTGRSSARLYMEQSARLAERLQSPVLRVWTAEVAVEYAAAAGDWDRALALGERTIGLARSLNQRALLPRVLVWTGLLHLARGDLERGERCVREAWELSGAAGDRPRDVHAAVPAHAGMMAFWLAAGDVPQAIRIGEAGLALADRTGYTVWAIHRLLPILGEAYAQAGDLDGLVRVSRRLRADSERLGHKLGLAWAAAGEAVVEWRSGDLERSARLLREAAEELDAIPFKADAARLRRQLAARLRDLGRREEALVELRAVHEVFARLGAQRELEKTREQLRELGARPPARSAPSGAEGLTERELEIVRLAVEGKSNKAIGKALGISPRTVGTHLSNVFRKLEVGSRGELAEAVRRGLLLEEAR